MITFQSVAQADFNTIQFQAVGDNTATVMSVNVGMPPFAINYQGVFPNAFLVDVGQDGVTATASFLSTGAGPVVTVTFSSPPPNDELTTVTLTSIWNSLT